MPIHTTMLDFHVDPAIIIADSGDCSKLQQDLGKIMKKFGYEKEFLKTVKNGYLEIFADSKGNHASLRGYSDGEMTLTIEEWLDENEASLDTSQKIKDLETSIGDLTKSTRIRSIPAIKRGDAINVYCATSDNRLLEYDFDKVLFDQVSPYQHIQIYHSFQFGNMLCLDDLQNIADSDLIYTHTIMRYGIEDYSGKTVLILGGGDGGLLNELRKENPKFITMIEIDEMVIDACRKHLRGVCGDSLDSLKGENYEVIIDDCLKLMKGYSDEGKTFDYVISDLTDIPLTPTPQGEFWDFIRTILELSFLVLSPNGKFLMHGNGMNSVKALAMFEEQLGQLSTKVEFKRHTAFVPSFMETWVFYEAWKCPILQNGK